MQILIWGLNFKFGGDAYAGVSAGHKAYVKRWSNADISKADLDRTMLGECLPPSNHFSEKEYMSAIEQVRKGNYGKAGDILTAAATSTASPICVALFKKLFIELVLGCPKILSDAIPMSYY